MDRTVRILPVSRPPGRGLTAQLNRVIQKEEVNSVLPVSIPSGGSGRRCSRRIDRDIPTSREKKKPSRRRNKKPTKKGTERRRDETKVNLRQVFTPWKELRDLRWIQKRTSSLLSFYWIRKLHMWRKLRQTIVKPTDVSGCLYLFSAVSLKLNTHLLSPPSSPSSENIVRATGQRNDMKCIAIHKADLDFILHIVRITFPGDLRGLCPVPFQPVEGHL